MLEALSQLWIGFVVALSGTLIPGPMLAFIAMKSSSFGPKTGPFAADVSWFSLVSFSVSKGRQLVSGKFYVGLLAACGCTLLVFGGYFLMRYIPLLL